MVRIAAQNRDNVVILGHSPFLQVFQLATDTNYSMLFIQIFSISPFSEQH